MTETKETNPKDRAATNRLDLSLVPSSSVAFTALALTEGDLKYGGYNWRVAGVKASVYVAAAQRHLLKWLNGEDQDPVTKVPHLANASACLAVLIDAICCDNLVDDRPPVQDLGGLLRDMEGHVAHLRKLYEQEGGPRRCTQEGS